LALAAAGVVSPEVAGTRLATLLANERGEELALDWLDVESLAVPVPSLRACLVAARAAGAEPAVFDRLVVCAGIELADEGERADAVFAKAEWNDADWRVAGARVARVGGTLDLWPRQDTERDVGYATFLQRLEAERDKVPEAKNTSKPLTEKEAQARMKDAWVQGCVRAFRRLNARQSVPGAHELLRRLRVIFQRSQHPFRRELGSGRFPPLSPATLVDVNSREPWIGFSSGK
ncbi:MAG TPA: hypothetical protein VM509_10800, partial [Planctomycetota bacterium]|nr:hypothetical protein [Planctomycetota bacterium]